METDVETAEEEEEVKQLFRLEEDWRGGGREITADRGVGVGNQEERRLEEDNTTVEVGRRQEMGRS